MGEIISVISGKGGTGKTTLCAAIATCLAVDGKRVLCIDADIGLRNLDIALGMADLPLVDFTDVMLGHYSLQEIPEHPEFPGLFLLTAPIRQGEAPVDEALFGQMLEQVRQEFDFCLIDAPAGIGTGFHLATRFADRFLLVSTSDPASIRDAGRTADLLSLEKKNHVQLIINRVQPQLFAELELTVDDLMDRVGLPLFGLVPEDCEVPLAAAEDMPLILSTYGGAAEASLRISRRLRGVSMPLMKLK